MKDFSIEIHNGEFVAVLGPNGAGKSTLLKILATHIFPSSGVVKVHGEDAFKEGEKIRKKIGYVAHESFLYDELTIEENLRFYAKVFSSEQDFLPLIEIFNLKDWYHTPAKRLSYGLRKRADIVRALIHNPNIILLDELFAGLDEQTRSLLVNHFKEQQEKTLLLSSHSLDLAKQLCGRGIFLDRGNMVKDINF